MGSSVSGDSDFAPLQVVEFIFNRCVQPVHSHFVPIRQVDAGADQAAAEAYGGSTTKSDPGVGAYAAAG